jgi:peptide/nickel transport system substrate-binding protein
MTSRYLRLAAVLLIALTLTGCANGNRTITLLNNAPTPAPGVDQASVDNYSGEGEYAANSSNAAPGEIMPAPATEDELKNAAQAATAERAETPPPATNYSSADMVLGLVAGPDAEVNPLHCKYEDIMNINALVYEPLVELDDNLQPAPMLADRWAVSGDTWTFTLRGDVEFHDGDPLTAQDVVASYEEIMKYPANYWQPLLDQAVVSMSAGDEGTLVVKAKGSIGYMLLYAMTFPVCSQNTAASAQPMGTGPYWYISYDAGYALRIEQNPRWWRRANTPFKSIVGMFCGNNKIAMNLLETGEVNALASDYPTMSLSRQLSDRKAVDYSTNTYECIVPNLRDPIVGDLAVRQALMYAIDRTTLATTTYAGLVQESEVPVVPGSWIYNAQATRYNYSPERALKLLTDDGWKDLNGDNLLEKESQGSLINLKLELITYDRGTTSTRSDAVNLLASQLRMVGFDVETKVLSSREVFDKMNTGDFQLALCAFELSDIPNLNFLVGKTGTSNYERYGSDDTENLLRAAWSAATEEDLQADMYSLQLKLVEDLPILGLFFRTGLTVAKVPLGQLDAPRLGNCLRGLPTSSAQ